MSLPKFFLKSLALSFVLFALLSFVAILVPATLAQVPDPAVATQAPQTGTGHHYIGLATETVSPSSGELEFHLPISTPPGRELSFPFGILYSGPEQYFLSGTNAPTLAWQVGWPITTVMNGWSYDVPTAATSAKVANAWV